MPTRPLLSVIVPTIGRASLDETLTTIRRQAPASEVEIIVVGDTFGGDFQDALATVPAVCAEYSAKYLGHDGGMHMVGQFQRQRGMAYAQGEWLMFSQDDNVYLPGAFDAITAALGAGLTVPHLFRVMTRFGFIVWDVEGDLGVGRVDADCIVVPNVPERLGSWGLSYIGDQQFIAQTVALWDGQVAWDDALIVDSRPGGVV